MWILHRRARCLLVCLVCSSVACSYTSTYQPPDDGRARAVWKDDAIVAHGIAFGAECASFAPTRERATSRRRASGSGQAGWEHWGYSRRSHRYGGRSRGSGRVSRARPSASGGGSRRGTLGRARSAAQGGTPKKSRSGSLGASGGGGDIGEALIVLAVVFIAVVAVASIANAASPAIDSGVGPVLDRVNRFNDSQAGADAQCAARVSQGEP
ncbi:MAG: hypothetical protein AAFP04_01795 [Myxococcota bacterium]